MPHKITCSVYLEPPRNGTAIGSQIELDRCAASPQVLIMSGSCNPRSAIANSLVGVLSKGVQVQNPIPESLK